MGSILNGIAVHGGTRVYGGTFLQFSDYMRGAVRLAALMEHAGHLRLDARLGRPRRGRPDPPADRAPVVAAEHPRTSTWSARPTPTRPRPPGRRSWSSTDRPAALCLSRQNVPTFDRVIFAPAARRGARRVRDGRRHRRDLDRDGLRGPDRGRRARAARGRRDLGPGRVDAVHGMVYRAGRFLSRGSAAGRDAGAGVGRGGHHPAVEDLRRRRRRVGRRRSLRRLGGRRRDLREVRHHGRGGRRRREVVHREGARLARRTPTDLSKPYRQEGSSDMSDVLKEITAAGVSIWLDDISRNRLTTGNLASPDQGPRGPRGDVEPDDLRQRAGQGRRLRGADQGPRGPRGRGRRGVRG